MEALALSDLRNHILFRGHTRLNLLDPVGDSSTTGTTNLNLLINKWKDKTIEAHPFSWRHGHFSFAVNASKPEIDMPDDFQSVTSFYNDEWKLVGMSQQEYRQKIFDGDDDSGSITHYIPVANPNGALLFRFWPIEADTIECDYLKKFADLKEATDTFTVTSGVPEGIISAFQSAVIEGVLVDVYEYQNDERKATMAIQKFEAYVGQLIDLDIDHDKVYELDSHSVEGFSVPRLPNKYDTRRHW